MLLSLSNKKQIVNHSLKRFHIVLVLQAVTVTVTSKKVRYDEHKLYSIRIETETDSRIKREIDRLTTVDYKQNRENLNVTVLVEPHDAPRLESLLKANNVSHEALVGTTPFT